MSVLDCPSMSRPAAPLFSPIHPAISCSCRSWLGAEASERTARRGDRGRRDRRAHRSRGGRARGAERPGFRGRAEIARRRGRAAPVVERITRAASARACGRGPGRGLLPGAHRLPLVVGPPPRHAAGRRDEPTRRRTVDPNSARRSPRCPARGGREVRGRVRPSLHRLRRRARWRPSLLRWRGIRARAVPRWCRRAWLDRTPAARRRRPTTRRARARVGRYGPPGARPLPGGGRVLDDRTRPPGLRRTVQRWRAVLVRHRVQHTVGTVVRPHRPEGAARPLRRLPRPGARSHRRHAGGHDVRDASARPPARGGLGAWARYAAGRRRPPRDAGPRPGSLSGHGGRRHPRPRPCGGRRRRRRAPPLRGAAQAAWGVGDEPLLDRHHAEPAGASAVLPRARLRDRRVPRARCPRGALEADERRGVTPAPDHPRLGDLALLGTGSMGVVYRAYDKVLRQLVALKTLPRLDPEEVYWLKSEFRALADVRHTNLAELHELVVDETHCFFTMELVDGVDLLTFTGQLLGVARTADGDPARWAALDDCVRQLVAGVRAIHDAGKLHRDIKPANILVTPERRVVLLDFGLTIPLRGGTGAGGDGGVAGTFAYMAPEQAWGRPLSPKADWYSVGVVLYEALTGELPFLEAAADRRLRDPRVRAPAVPERHGELVVALLDPDPARRPGADGILDRPAANPAAPPATSPPSGEEFVGRLGELHPLHRTFERTEHGAVSVHVFGEYGLC